MFTSDSEDVEKVEIPKNLLDLVTNINKGCR
jgi:hypothetical protein